MPTTEEVNATMDDLKKFRVPVLILSGHSTWRTSSSRISAAVPGRVPRPAAASSVNSSRSETPGVCAPCQISSGENACTCICGTAAFTARTIPR